MQRPSWSGFQFPIELPLESVGGRLNQTGESAMLFDVGLTVESFSLLSVTVDVLDKTDAVPMLLAAGLEKTELTAALLDVGISRYELVPLILDIWLPYEPTLLIRDRQRQIQAVLPDVSWQYERRINEATGLSFAIPRQVVIDNIEPGHNLAGFLRGNKAQYAEIAAFAQVLAGGRLKATGKIVGRSLGEIVTIQAYTEEILLDSNLTPAQYGKVWDGWDLADVARDLLDGWRVSASKIRASGKATWWTVATLT